MLASYTEKMKERLTIYDISSARVVISAYIVLMAEQQFSQPDEIWSEFLSGQIYSSRREMTHWMLILRFEEYRYRRTFDSSPNDFPHRRRITML